MSVKFLRHTKMSAWGYGVAIAEGDVQLAIAFADGVTRRFEHALVGKLLVEDEPTDEEREVREASPELPALEELDASFNAFSKAGAQRLAGHGAEVRGLPFR